MVRGKTDFQVTDEMNVPQTKSEYKEENFGDWGRKAHLKAWKSEVPL